MAFGKGGCKCLGIELARAELYLVTAALLEAFAMRLWETNESYVAFAHDYHIVMSDIDSKEVRVMSKAL